jgi:hypothetical protein
MFSSRKSSAPSGGYNLTNSLRFRSSASAYLNRTPASAGNANIWTWSAWVKRGSLGSAQVLLSAATDSNNFEYLRFESTNELFYTRFVSGVQQDGLTTTAVFRDPSAWYHIVMVRNGATRTIYVNNVNMASGGSSAATGEINQVKAHSLFRRQESASQYFDGYATEIVMIDGQALTPSSFGETSATTGVWIPKKYTGTYGTNGFYLDFEDTSSTAALGYDAAGSNDWTVNNISLTAGSTYDSMTDVPTLTSATAANYCTLNPLNLYTGTSCANGNLQGTTVTGAECGIYGTIGMTSGKFYWESTPSSISSGGCMIGIAPATTQGSSGSPGLTVTTGYGYYTTGSKYAGSGGVAYGNTFTTSDVIGVALDLDNGKIWFGKQTGGTGSMVWQASGDPVAGTNAAFTSVSGTFVPGIGNGGAGSFSTVNVNFGQQPWSATPPTGFVALNTFNLPTPTIGATASTTANKYMDVLLHTGNGGSQSITGLNFSPDFWWVKSRNLLGSHCLFDQIRGANSSLFSELTLGENNNWTGQSFNSNGVTADAAYSYQTNGTGYTFVDWFWKANGAGVSNTAGTIASTVSANTTAGFSIVTYTGTGSNATVGHGLGVVPSMVIVKNRDAADAWQVYHAANTAAPETDYLVLNTDAATADAADRWNDTLPTSTVFSIGNGVEVNTNTEDYVAYCFAQVAGYSAFGSYTGNGSSDGPFVFTGFRPKFVMIKSSSTGGAGYDWFMWDSSRNTYNVVDHALWANLSDAENTTAMVDFVSNGFKIRLNSSAMNGSGTTFIYMAFAEVPTKFSLAR